MATAALIVTGLSVAGSAIENRKARKERQKARAIEQKSSRLQAGRSAIQQIRKAQIARADVISQAEAQGVAGSSAVQGSTGSIQSQAGSNIAFAQQLFNLQSQASARMESAERALGRSESFRQVGQLASNWI